MLRPGLLAVVLLPFLIAPALASQGRIRMAERPCPDLSQILSFGRPRGGAAPDGGGGAFVVWGDDRAVSVQRFDSAGRIAMGWPASGLAVGWIAAGEEGYQSFVAADSAGGALVAWIGRQGEVRLQRVVAGCGIAAGWPAEGVVLCDLAGTGRYPAVALTDRSSAVVAWREQEIDGTQSIRFARVRLSAGPVVVGPANGQALASGDGLANMTEIVPDGRGGALVLWRRWGDAERTTTLVLQRVLASGGITPGWPVDGVVAGDRVALGVSFDEDVDQPLLAPDGQGGAMVVWSTGRAVDARLYEVDLVAQRVTGQGRLAPGWPANGRTVAGERGDQRLAAIAPDRQGLLVAWFDDGAEGRVRLVRLDGSGSVATWGAAPVRAADRVVVGADGRGGAFVAWNDPNDRAGVPRLLPWSAWGPGRAIEIAGTPITGGWDTSRLLLVTDGHGGALVAWHAWPADASPPRTVVRVATAGAR